MSIDPLTAKIIRCVGLYLRVSTEDQAREGYSLENQQEADRAFAKLKFGPDVHIEIYSDVESGYSIRRANYMRLLKDCQSGKIHCVVCWRIDRFTRNTSAGIADLADLTVNIGIPVWSVMEGLVDFKDPNNKLQTTMLLAMAEHERNRLIQRTMPGMKRGALSGHYQGTRYVILGAGYDKANKKLYWVDSEVKLIQILFERVANGESVHSVTKYLYRQGYRDRKGGPLTTSLLCKVIKRPIYYDGYYRWNGIESEKPILEPIVDQATWEKANRNVAAFRWKGSGPKKGSPRDDSLYCLQGALKCRRCGSNMVGHSARLGIRYYVCSKQASRTSAACAGQWIKAEPVEAQALNILRTAISNPYIVGMAKEEIRNSIRERNPEIQTAIRVGEKQLRELESNHRKLLDLRYKDAVSTDQFKIENDRIRQEQEVVQRSLEQLKTQLFRLQHQNENLSKIFGILENFDKLYDKLDPKSKKNLYSCVFRFAHAKCLGRRKPKYIDNFELTEPFDALHDRKKWTIKPTFPPISLYAHSSTSFKPTAAR